MEVTRRQQEVQRHASLVSKSEAAQAAVVKARSADRTKAGGSAGHTAVGVVESDAARRTAENGPDDTRARPTGHEN
jgi:hypothetical protein